jgi:hypothetical protein
MTALLRHGWFLVASWLMSSSYLVNAQSAPELTLTIIPSTYGNRDLTKPEIWFSHRSHFHVLLTNVSAHPVTLFQEWNSWGYYGLAFEVTYPDGRKVITTRGPRGWDKNFPSTFTLAPQGHYVFEVSFDHTWTSSPRTEPTSGHGLSCRLRALYSIERQKDDDMLLEPGAPLPWAGTVQSKEEAYLLWP